MTASFSFARARISDSSSRTSAAERSLPDSGLATGSWTGMTGRVMRSLGLARRLAARRGTNATGRRGSAQPLLLPSESNHGIGGSVRIAVTTALHPSREEEQAAGAAAARWSLPLAARGGRSTAEVRVAEGVEALLVLTRLGASLVLPPEPSRPAGAGERVDPRSGERVHVWSPGMGALRAKRVGRLLHGAPS